MCGVLFYSGAIYFVAEKQKEVAPQDFADAEKLVCVDTFAPEDVVHVGAVAAQFACEPGDGTLLGVEFLFDGFTYVYHDVAVRVGISFRCRAFFFCKYIEWGADKRGRQRG